MRVDIYSDTICPVLPGQAAFRAAFKRVRNTPPYRLAAVRIESGPPLEARARRYMAAKFGDTSKIEESQATLTRLGQASVSSSVSI